LIRKPLISCKVSQVLVEDWLILGVLSINWNLLTLNLYWLLSISWTANTLIHWGLVNLLVLRRNTLNWRMLIKLGNFLTHVELLLSGIASRHILICDDLPLLLNVRLNAVSLLIDWPIDVLSVDFILLQVLLKFLTYCLVYCLQLI
jgi:hypothetical protein